MNKVSFKSLLLSLFLGYVMALKAPKRYAPYATKVIYPVTSVAAIFGNVIPAYAALEQVMVTVPNTQIGTIQLLVLPLVW